MASKRSESSKSSPSSSSKRSRRSASSSSNSAAAAALPPAAAAAPPPAAAASAPSTATTTIMTRAAQLRNIDDEKDSKSLVAIREIMRLEDQVRQLRGQGEQVDPLLEELQKKLREKKIRLGNEAVKINVSTRKEFDCAVSLAADGFWALKNKEIRFSKQFMAGFPTQDEQQYVHDQMIAYDITDHNATTIFHQ